MYYMNHFLIIKVLFLIMNKQVFHTHVFTTHVTRVRQDLISLVFFKGLGISSVTIR